MAGTGPAPKAPSERRGHVAPTRGEWVALPAPFSDFPSLPARTPRWSARTRRAWLAWWSDPASTQWGPGDLDLLEHLADVFEVWTRERRSPLAAEVRQVRDSLGLTPKGKQDRRWKVSAPGEVVPIVEQKSAAEKMEELRKRAAAAGRAS